MLQLFVVAFVPGYLFHARIFIGAEGRFLAALIAFVINYACYFSEIYRGGIESIPKGQYEAAQVLGMSKKDVFFKVVLLQVVKRVLAPMSNEVITLVKIMSEDLQAIRLSVWIPFQTCLGLPAGHETPSLKDAVSLIYPSSFIGTLDKSIPFRTELIVKVCDK